MKYDLYGMIVEEEYYTYDIWENRINFTKENIGEFNPDSDNYFKLSRYDGEPIACNFIESTNLIEYKYIKTMDVEATPNYIGSSIKLNNKDYRINEIILNTNKERYEIYINYAMETVKIPKEDKDLFLEKVSIYQKKIDNIHKEFEENKKRKEEYANRSYIRKLIDKIKGVI